MQIGNGCSNLSKDLNCHEVQPHYRQILPFTIDYTLLQIKRDFDPNGLKDCMLKLIITALRHINEIGLDMQKYIYII